MIKINLEKYEKTSKKSKILVVILKFENANLIGTKKFYNQTLFGKKIIDFVKEAVSDYPTKIITVNQNTNFVELLLPFCKSYNYIGVLYCDTPLLTKQTVTTALDFAELKQINICKLPRGYIFKTEFLKNYDKNEKMQPFNYFDHEFAAVTNFVELEQVEKTMQTNINVLHMKNGVKMINANSIYIETSVKIEKGVTIYPNNLIFGNSLIKQNTTLLPNNTITNSTIGKNCKIEGVTIKNCIVKNNTILNGKTVFVNCEIVNNL